MDPRVQAAFIDELEKIALAPAQMAGGAAIIAAGLLGGIAIYDHIKGMNMPTLDSDEMRGVKGKTRVNSAKHIKALLKNRPVKKVPIVVTKVPEIKAAMKAMGEDEFFTTVVTDKAKDVLKSRDNAFVASGEKADVLVIAPEMHRGVVEHEMGHVFSRDEGKEKTPGLGEFLLSRIWKPTYDRVIMDRERGAWKRAPGYPDMERKALETYDKGFHRSRKKTLSRLGLGAGLTGAALLLHGH